jgi:cyclic nucleotide gated channel, plant
MKKSERLKSIRLVF